MARHPKDLRGALGTPFALVAALDLREEDPRDPDAHGTVCHIEDKRKAVGIPTATEEWSRPEPRTKMVIVPTWFVHPLATDLPTPR